MIRLILSMGERNMVKNSKNSGRTELTNIELKYLKPF